MPIFQIQNKKLKVVKEKKFNLEKDLQILTEENLEEVFGLQFVSGKLNKQLIVQNFIIDTLAFDKETNSFIIIEYKRDQSFSVIDQGFNYLGLMRNNKAEFILEYNERTNSNLKKGDVDWSQSKILFIAPTFTPHQKGAIAFKDLPIELWEVSLYENNLVLYNQIKPAQIGESIKNVSKSKTVQEISSEVKTYTLEDHLVKADDTIKDLFEKFRHEIFEIDQRIQEKPVSWYVGYKIRYHNFCTISLYKQKIRLHVRKDSIDDPKKVFKVIPAKWGWGKTKIWYWDCSDEREVDYAMTVIRQAYEAAPDK